MLDDGVERQLVHREPTKTGIDVPVGYRYRVDVHARSEEGVTQTQRFDLDFTR